MNKSQRFSFQASGFSFTLGIVLLGFVLSLPSGVTAWFDGLPWTGEAETFALSAIIPFLLILGWRFLSLRMPLFFLAVLLVLKLIMFASGPSGGLLVKVYPNLSKEDVIQARYAKIWHESLTSGKWVRTYATSWNENASGVLKKSWTNKLQFPMDWFLLGNGPKDVYQQFDELNPIIELEGVVLVPEGKRFALIAEGVEEGSLLATNEEGERFDLFPAKDFEEARLQKYQLPEGERWKLSGKLGYFGKNWSFIPVLVEGDGVVNTQVGRGVLWQEESVSSGAIGFYIFLSWVLDAGIILFFVAWGAWTFRHLSEKQVLTVPLAAFSVLAVLISLVMAPFFSHVLKMAGLVDLTRFSNLGITFIITAAGFLLWSYSREDYRNFQHGQMGQTVFLLFGPAMLVFFSDNWYSQLGQWWKWDTGNDWTSFQNFARQVIVGGEWLNAGEGVFMMQPLYRYFVAVYHWLFGQSAFVQHMADVWCVLGAAALLSALISKFRLSVFTAFITSTLYLMITLIGSFRYHIGRSLVEHHAMIFMMLAIWYMYGARKGGTFKIVLATFFGVLAFWTRLDHLGAIVCLAFLAFEPAEGPTGGWRGYWDRIKLHWQRLAGYWAGGIIIGVCGMALRNWWVGGAFLPYSPSHPNLVGTLERAKYYLILTGNEWPVFPSLSGFIVSAGTLLALLALVWRPKPLLNFPLGLGVTILGLLAPYVFLWTGGYQPRFSIHLLPLALLSLAIFLDNFSRGIKFQLWSQIRSLLHRKAIKGVE